MLRGAGFLSLLAALIVFPSHSKAEQKYTLTIAPAALPSPLLKYRLMPDPRELKAGNAATIYYRSEAMFVENSFLLKELQGEQWSEWSTMPLKELPLVEIEKKVQIARNFVRELEIAGTYRDCDWQLSEREDGFALLLPEVQGFRMLARLLAVKARLHIARAEYAEAVRAMRIGNTLGCHLGKGPSLIHMLVGIAIVGEMAKQLDTLVQQSDSPNLYWTLRTRPDPLFDPRPILLKESQWLEQMWPFLTRLDKGVLSALEIQTGIAQIDKRIAEFNIAQAPFKNAGRSAAIVAMHAASRSWLIKNGHDKDRVEAMNPVQAVLLATYQQYRQSYDEWLVWALAGETDKQPGMKAARDRANAAAEVLDRLFFSNLLNGLSGPGGVISGGNKVQDAGLRLERHHVGLATLEAFRAHAASDGGKWPESLDAIKVVPVPVDPLTRKAWDFHREGNWITLTSPLAEGEKPTSTTHFIFRVQVREK